MSNKITRYWKNTNSNPYMDEPQREKSSRSKKYRPQFEKRIKREEKFRCLNCSLVVTAEHELSGVNNRNHCPNCLWSKHVDLDKAGDRKSACAAGMRPIGLTVKKVAKKYNQSAQGELMIIHQCSGCGKISINRIAADDSAGVLLQLYQSSQRLDAPLLELLGGMGIQPLRAGDLTTVYSQLFGWQSILGEFTAPLEAMALLEKSFPADETDKIE